MKKTITLLLSAALMTSAALPAAAAQKEGWTAPDWRS